MALDQLDSFMQALGQLESGNDYGAVGPRHPTMGHARGRFQIMESNWNAWAADAGIPGANWRDPAAQDRVAAHKMTQYYRQFGSWDLVAVAWFAGPGRAKKAAERGLSSVGQLKDSLGTSVSGYVQKVMSLMGQPTSAPSGGGASGTGVEGGAGRGTTKPSGTPDTSRTPQETIDAGNHRITNPEEVEEDPAFGPREASLVMFEAIANAKAGGPRADYRTLPAPFHVGQDEDEQDDEVPPGTRPGMSGQSTGGGVQV